MEASALHHASPAPALVGRSPLLRLQSDERLIALIRRGHHGAFEALVQRYQPRLLAFCRHMLGSTEDAEDVLQEVFASAFNAMCADERPINARPWLYRIARNRCLNHLRRPVPAGQDSMDVFEREGGTTTADTVHRREEFRQLMSDVGELPETQRTALLLREIDALSYDQIAEAMDTTVPSIKSLLVRARVSLAEAAESRLLTCEEVRLELGQVAEGITASTAPVRRHLKHCERCRTFRSELRKTTKALAAIYPIGPLFGLKMLWTKLGGAAAGGTATAGSSTVAAGGAAAGGGAFSAGIGAVVSKAAAGIVAAAVVTAGAVEVRHVTADEGDVAPAPVATTAPAARGHSHDAVSHPQPPPASATPAAKPEKPAKPEPVAATATTAAEEATAAPADDESTAPAQEHTDDDAGASYPQGQQPGEPAPGEEAPPSAQPGGEPTPAPGEPRSTPQRAPTAPVAGETAPYPR